MCLKCKRGEGPVNHGSRAPKPWLAERNRSPEQRALVTRHGLWRHSLYQTWAGMMSRCYSPGHHAFHNYGGRGITVYDGWHDPRNFVSWIQENLGDRPAGHSLDRIDNHLGYQPGNVRWATRSEQALNTRPETRVRGSRKRLSKLTEETVRECRRRWRAGESQHSLAAEFGVSVPTMHKAMVGKTWTHVKVEA